MNNGKTVIIEKTASQTPWLLLVFFAFMALKLSNAIDWSWWWVTSPLWGPFAVFAAFVALLISIAIAVALIGLPIVLLWFAGVAIYDHFKA